MHCILSTLGEIRAYLRNLRPQRSSPVVRACPWGPVKTEKNWLKFGNEWTWNVISWFLWIYLTLVKAKMAMISLATEISNWVSRVWPFSVADWTTVIFRRYLSNARKNVHKHVFQPTCFGYQSMCFNSQHTYRNFNPRVFVTCHWCRQRGSTWLYQDRCSRNRTFKKCTLNQTRGISRGNLQLTKHVENHVKIWPFLTFSFPPRWGRRARFWWCRACTNDELGWPRISFDLREKKMT